MKENVMNISANKSSMIFVKTLNTHFESAFMHRNLDRYIRRA